MFVGFSSAVILRPSNLFRFAEPRSRLSQNAEPGRQIFHSLSLARSLFFHGLAEFCEQVGFRKDALGFLQS